MQAPAHPYALPQGTRLLNGKYAVGTVLGQGGFSLTYKGGDMQLRRYVAIKEYFPTGAVRHVGQVYLTDTAAFGKGKTAFLEEASVLARFSHPNIVRVLDRFEENSTVYVVLEFLEGQTLGQRLRDGKLMDEWEAVMLGIKLSEALEAIHGAGILHRDIKPDNIILTNDGRSVLIDFGTARAFDSGSAPMTQVLTAGYAPLEQYAANAPQGPQTDIYALAATLYHALGGEPPVAATDRALDIPLVPLKSRVARLSPMVSNAIGCGLNLDMAARPVSARQFIDMLQGRVPARVVDGVNRAGTASTATTPTTPPPAAPAPVHYAPPPVAVGVPGVVAPPPVIKGAVGGNPELSAGLDFMKLKRHTLAVNSLSFAPDGTTFASAGQDRNIQLWNVADATPGNSIQTHSGGVTCIAYSPDGAFIVAGTVEGVIFFVNPATRQQGPLMRDAMGQVFSISFCPTKRIFACGTEGEWSVRDGNTGQVLARTKGPCPALAFSPDGSYLAVSGGRGMVQLVSSETGGSLGQIQAHQDDLEQLSFSPDGALMATGGVDGFVRVWQVSNGQMMWEQQPFILPAMGLSWSPDGKFLATAHRDSVYIWSRDGFLWRGFTNHIDRVRDVEFAPRPTAPYDYILASCSRDRTVELCRISAPS